MKKGNKFCNLNAKALIGDGLNQDPFIRIALQKGLVEQIDGPSETHFNVNSANDAAVSGT